MLDAVGNDNAKGEYYLTDIVEIAARAGLDVVATEASAESVLGINNRAELAEAEGIWQRRRRREAMLSGVTLIAPETVYFSHDTEIGADTLVEPNVLFGPGVKIASGATIHAFSHIEGASIAQARGRPVRAAAARRGSAREGEGRQFLRGQEGDDRAGRQGQPPDLYRRRARSAPRPISAPAPSPATMTASASSSPRSGAGAFIGSNSSLVAPVTIGDGAYVASGSVITEDVPADALAFGRARQKTLPGKGKELRERFAAAAAAKKKAD